MATKSQPSLDDLLEQADAHTAPVPTPSPVAAARRTSVPSDNLDALLDQADAHAARAPAQPANLDDLLSAADAHVAAGPTNGVTMTGMSFDPDRPALTPKEQQPGTQARAEQYLRSRLPQPDRFESAMSAEPLLQMGPDESTAIGRGWNQAKRFGKRLGSNVVAIPDAVVDQLATSADAMLSRSMGHPQHETIAEDLAPAAQVAIGMTPPALAADALRSAFGLMNPSETSADAVDSTADALTLPAAVALGAGAHRLFSRGAAVLPPDLYSPAEIRTGLESAETPEQAQFWEKQGKLTRDFLELNPRAAWPEPEAPRAPRDGLPIIPRQTPSLASRFIGPATDVATADSPAEARSSGRRLLAGRGLESLTPDELAKLSPEQRAALSRVVAPFDPFTERPVLPRFLRRKAPAAEPRPLYRTEPLPPQEAPRPQRKPPEWFAPAELPPADGMFPDPNRPAHPTDVLRQEPPPRAAAPQPAGSRTVFQGTMDDIKRQLLGAIEAEYGPGARALVSGESVPSRQAPATSQPASLPSEAAPAQPSTTPAAAAPVQPDRGFFKPPPPSDSPASDVTKKRIAATARLIGEDAPEHSMTEAQAAQWMRDRKSRVIARTGGVDLTPGEDLPIRPPELPDKGLGSYDRSTNPQNLGNRMRDFARGMDDSLRQKMAYRTRVVREMSKSHEKLTPRQHQAVFWTVEGAPIPEDAAVIKAGGLEPVVQRLKNLRDQVGADPRVPLKGFREDYGITRAGRDSGKLSDLLTDTERGEGKRRLLPSFEKRRQAGPLDRSQVKDVNVYDLADRYASQAFDGAVTNPWIKAAERELFGDGGSQEYPSEMKLPDGTTKPSYAQEHPSSAAHFNDMMRRVFGLSGDALDAMTHNDLQTMFADSALAKRFGITPQDAVNGTGFWRYLGKLPWAGERMSRGYVEGMASTRPTAAPMRLGGQLATLKGVTWNPASLLAHVVTDGFKLMHYSRWNPVELYHSFANAIRVKDPALLDRMRQMGVYESSPDVEAVEAAMNEKPGKLAKAVQVSTLPLRFVDLQFKKMSYYIGEQRALKAGATPEEAMLAGKDHFIATQSMFGPTNTQPWLQSKVVSPFAMFLRPGLAFKRIPVEEIVRGNPAGAAQFVAEATGAWMAGKLFCMNILPTLFHGGLPSVPAMLRMPYDTLQGAWQYATGETPKDQDKGLRRMLPSVVNRGRDYLSGQKPLSEAAGLHPDQSDGEISPSSLGHDLGEAFGQHDQGGKRRFGRR